MNREQKNTLLPYSLDTSVSNLFPDLFERPVLFIYSDTKIVELTAYLAIGPQIYADRLLVMKRTKDKKQDNFQGESGTASKRVIGYLGSKHIISHIMQTDPPSYRNSLYTTTALDIMDSVSGNQIIQPSSPIRRVIDIFKEKRFAFVPVVSRITASIRNTTDPRKNADNISHENHDDMITTTAAISVRDFLRLLIKPERQTNDIIGGGNSQEEITIPLNEISTNLVSVSKYDSLKDTIDLMIKRSIRNIGIRDENSSLIGIINDRSILEFLFTHKDFVIGDLHHKRNNGSENRKNSIGTNGNQIPVGRQVIDDKYYTNDNNKTDIPRSINSIMSELNIIPLSKLKVMKTTTLSFAAEVLTDLNFPCLILEEEENRIVTPWDVVIKTAELSN